MTSEQKPPKRDSEIRHQKQVFWQILTPIIVAILGLLLVTILSTIGAGKTPEINEKWANISTIFLLLPTILFGLLILALVIVAFWLLRKVTKNIPPYTSYIYHLFNRTNGITKNIAIKSAEPFIQVGSLLAGFSKLLTLASHNKTNHKE